VDNSLGFRDKSQPQGKDLSALKFIHKTTKNDFPPELGLKNIDQWPCSK